MQDYSGHHLGSYYLKKKIEAGKFTTSYLAEDSQHHNSLTITVFPPCPSNLEQLYFTKRAEAIIKLQHARIKVINDFDIHKGIPFIVTTASPLPTLQQCYPRGTRLDKHLILEYSRECANALQYAHDSQIIHGNIGSEALRIDFQNAELQVDFSLAFLSLPCYAQTMKQQAEYAIYIAPEQFASRHLPASDQYALGILIYQMLSGNGPFQGSAGEIKQQHLSASPPSLGKRVANISPYLEEVIGIALAKDPTKRFRSIQAFRRALENATDYQANPSQRGNSDHIPQDTNWIDSLEEQISLLDTTPLKKITIETASEPIRKFLPATSSEPIRQQLPVLPQPSISIVPIEKYYPRRTILTTLGTISGITTLLLAGGVALSRNRQPTPSPTHIASSPHAIMPQQASNPNKAKLGGVISTLTGHTESIFSIAWATDSVHLVTGSADRSAITWNALTGKALLHYRGHTDQVVSVGWSPDGTRIASGSHDKSVHIWEASSGKTLVTYTQHVSLISAIAWSLDSRYIVSASEDNSVQVWEARNGNLLYKLTFAKRPNTVAWSPNNQYFAVGSEDKQIRVYSASNGQLLQSYPGHTESIRGLAWSPDGKSVASASNDQSVQIWDALSGKQLLAYKGHQQAVTAVSWSSDGKHITSSALNVIQIWDAKTGQRFYIYNKHLASVYSVQYVPKGSYLASAGDERDVLVWNG